MAGDGVSLGTLVRRRRRWAQRWGRVCTGFVGIDAAAGVVEGWAGAEQAGAVRGGAAGAGCGWKRGPGRGPVRSVSFITHEAWAWTGHGQIHGGLRDDCAAPGDG